ncbi:MAG: 3-dehydroquinate synthase, partial [Hyphomicrobiaceae bacterium]
MTVANIVSSVYLQRFAVSYEYPVHFTNRLFDPANPILKDTLTRLEPNRRHRCLVFVDDGLV